MAFNPFHRFRKHQKAFFAVMTIVCMLVFVLQFGAGDVFTRALNWFGYVGRKGDYVLTLYGNKVYQGDLDRLRARRQLAQEFLTSPFPGIMINPNAGIASAQYMAVLDLAEKQAKRKGPGEPGLLPFGPVERIPDAFRTRMQQPWLITPEEHSNLATNELRQIREAAQSRLVEDKPEQIEALTVLAHAIAFEAWFFDPARLNSKVRDDLVFGGSTRPEDLLDFLIWKHEADRLGITLTEADVIREINRAACSRFLQKPLMPDEPFERNPLVRQFLRPGDRERRQGPGATTNDLYEALRDEYRVQLAKEAIMGHGSGVRAYVNEAEPVRMTPTAATPDEFLTYFRENRTTLKVALLPVAVADLKDQVTKQPSEEALQYIYDEYKNKEANPASPTPGYREPRRLRLQYFSVSAGSPHYQAEAKKLARELAVYSDPATSAAYRVAAGFNAAPVGGPAAWFSAAFLANGFDPLRDEYKHYRDEEEREAARDLRSGFDLRDRSPLRERPQVYASLVGQLLGGGLTGTMTPAAGLSILPGLEALHERTTLRAFGSEVLAGASGSPFTALALPVPFTHAALPREAVRPLLVQRIEKDLARALVAENLAAFQNELGKLKNKPAEAEKYIARAVKDFGVESSLKTMKHLDSVYDVAEDPELKPLKDAWEAFRKERNDLREQFRQAPMILQQFPPPPPPLAAFLFNSTSPLFQPVPFAVTSGPERNPFRMGETETTTWVFWRVEDRPAHQRDFAQVRDEVADWWRLNQARKIASDEAERLSKELNQKHLSAADALAFLRDQKRGSVVELDNVALLIPPRKPEIFFGGQDTAEFKPYEAPPDKVAYPPANFVRDLLTLKAVGDAMVVPDQPRKHYYVAVLLARSVPTLREFYDLYNKAAPDDQLWQQMMQDRRRDFYDDLMKQMRVDAAGKDNVNEDGTLKIPASVRKNEGSGESE